MPIAESNTRLISSVAVYCGGVETLCLVKCEDLKFSYFLFFFFYIHLSQELYVGLKYCTEKNILLDILQYFFF